MDQKDSLNPLEQELTRSLHIDDSTVYRSAVPHAGFEEQNPLAAPSFRQKTLEPFLDGCSIQTSLLDHSLKSQSLSFDFVEDNVPPSVPIYIEPAFHFFSSQKASSLLSNILNALKTLNIDFDLEPAKFKISCKAYRDGSFIPFIVRIFSNSRDSKFIVEFQRRSGDIMYFSDIYRYVKDTITSDTTPLLPTDSKCLPAPEPLQLETAIEATKHLLQMASSEFADVKAQAISFISSLNDPIMKKACLEVGMLETLLSSLSCRFEEVHRPCLEALANLCEKNVDACRRIVSHQNVRYLHSLSASDTKQVVRNCARVLKELCDAGFHSDKEIRKTVAGLSAHGIHIL